MLALLILILIQYSNSIYSLSYVKTILLFNAVTSQYPTSDAIEDGLSLRDLTDVPSSFSYETKSTRRHILIAQYTATRYMNIEGDVDVENIYEQFLSVTSKINAAYAIQWNHDYWIMRGIAFIDPYEPSQHHFHIERLVMDGVRQNVRNIISGQNESHDILSTIPDSRATYNKITLLELALMDQKYDGILILDADAMMYDFSRNIADLLSPHKTVLIAQKTTNSSDDPHTGSINVGVTLWNLRHKLTPYVVKRWKDKCVQRIMYHSDDKIDDDQAPLQYLLKYELDQNRRNKVVYAMDNEFHYARGLFVRHFIRPSGSVWTNSTLDSDLIRLSKMKTSANDVCVRYHPVCDQI
jgi:hypothetical protein